VCVLFLSAWDVQLNLKCYIIECELVYCVNEACLSLATWPHVVIRKLNDYFNIFTMGYVVKSSEFGYLLF
jgi:hypothetical protein